MSALPGKPLILHIDDDPVVRELVGEALAKAGMDVLAAGGILEGIQSALKQPPDLVLLDLHMPNGDGYEACLAFRAVPGLSAIPIILLTGMRDDEHLEKALSCGATDHLAKPCDARRLISAIKKRLKKTGAP